MERAKRAANKHKRTFPMTERFRFWLLGGDRNVDGLGITTSSGNNLVAYGQPPVWKRIRARLKGLRKK